MKYLRLLIFSFLISFVTSSFAINFLNTPSNATTRPYGGQTSGSSSGDCRTIIQNCITKAKASTSPENVDTVAQSCVPQQCLQSYQAMKQTQVKPQQKSNFCKYSSYEECKAAERAFRCPYGTDFLHGTPQCLTDAIKSCDAQCK